MIFQVLSGVNCIGFALIRLPGTSSRAGVAHETNENAKGERVKTINVYDDNENGYCLQLIKGGRRYINYPICTLFDLAQYLFFEICLTNALNVAGVKNKVLVY